MSKKVLVKKAEGGGVQSFYNISGERPSFGQLARRTRDPTASAWQKIGAGLGMLGKVGAAGVTGLQTAYGLQGGNVGAALQVPQSYAALDPTAGQANAVTPHEQQMEMQRKNMEEQRAKQLAAMNTLGLSVKDMHQMGSAPAQQPTSPPAGLPAPPNPAAVNVPLPGANVPLPGATPTPTPAPAAPAPAAPAPAAPAPAAPAPAAPAPTEPSVSPTAAAQLLPPSPTGQPAPATSNPINPQTAGEMLPTLPLQQTPPPNPPQFSGPMNIQQPAAPVAVSQPVDNGLTPHQGTLPVMMPQRTHADMRNQVAVRPPVTTPYTPQNTVNPFANPTGQKPGHAYNTGQYTPTQRQYGLSDKNDYRNRAMPANFGGISWDSAVPTLGDDPNINWTEELSKAFAKFVLNDFGDMLHKADPHVAGALAMRVFLEKMLRK